MTNIEIIKKAIEKVGLILYHSSWKDIMEHRNYYSIIFSHDFAKVFWASTSLYCSACDKSHKTKSDCDAGFGYKDLMEWEFHLRIMVLKKEPLKYLEKFL